MTKGTISVEKARRAFETAGRPGEDCRAEAGTWQPVVDRGACEGKAECVAVCPHEVFEVRRIEREDFRRLTLVGRLKSVAHGRVSAYTPYADRCRACGLCVVACPEKAIRLERARDVG